jgi:hypothetical protein
LDKRFVQMRVFPAFCRLALLLFALSCRGAKQQRPQPGDAAAELSEAGDVQRAANSVIPSLAVAASQIAAAVNPSGLAPYDGQTGRLEGTVYVDGANAPERPLDFSKCPSGKTVHGPLFRSEGSAAKRPLLDAIVGVTGYANAYIPASAGAVVVEIHECALNQRTFVLTLGQGIDVFNREPPLPNNFFALDLTLAPGQALMIAAPRGEPTHLYPQSVGHDVLADKMGRAYLSADIFVTRQPLNAVSRAGGKYRIDSIPVGTLQASAMHPALGGTSSVSKRDGASDIVQAATIVIRAGEATFQDFVLSYQNDTAATPRAHAPVVIPR